jgi:hypothetical protein
MLANLSLTVQIFTLIMVAAGLRNAGLVLRNTASLRIEINRLKARIDKLEREANP